MFYTVKSRWWLRKLYPQCTWSMPPEEKVIYLTFDDGPHPEITPKVLSTLAEFNAKATFFCIGRNVVEFPETYSAILDSGHAVGNHSYSHLNGWKTDDKVYLDDIAAAKKYIDSNMYRPPYGRIKKFQLSQLPLPRFELTAVMWSVLSGDFDENLSNENCLKNVIENTKEGDIVVFHDSEKAQSRMEHALKGTLKFFSEEGFEFKALNVKSP